ncbi:unnamed protein product [Prorocentrum cordatum]|uniref:PS II complex 12 kDa extrinsic protein n=1 Tax=Prorocentrum cordatum TaxID=2364126 RepID=A0ABN9XQV8_9DINO|nr:unnamed protein product [Polarella glacialis]
MARMFARALAAGVLVATQVDAVKIQASSEMNANSEMGSLTSANSEMSASALSEALGHMSAEAVQARISKYADQVGASRDEATVDDTEEEFGLRLPRRSHLRARVPERVSSVPAPSACARGPVLYRRRDRPGVGRTPTLPF